MKKILILLALITTSLFSASFDCDKANTNVEKLICSNDELSKLDEEMSKAYKEALSKTDDKETLKKEQRAWLKERNKCEYVTCIGEWYDNRMFYLQATTEQFILQYSEDNTTCDHLLNLLNNDLKENNEVNLSKHKEFNWVNWKYAQKREWYRDPVTNESNPRFQILVDYFDINNDGNDESVFIYETQHELLILFYTTKEDGKAVEEYIPYKIKNNGWTSKEGELLAKTLTTKTTETNNGFGVFVWKPLSEPTIKQNATGSMNSAEPYPIKLNNEYFIVIFGTIEGPNIRNIPVYTMPNNGNIAALVKYNPDNTRNDVCVLTRANPNTKKYFDDAKIEEQNGTK